MVRCHDQLSYQPIGGIWGNSTKSCVSSWGGAVDNLANGHHLFAWWTKYILD